MIGLRLIEPLPLQRIQSLLNDDSVEVQPINVHYTDYTIHNNPASGLSPLRFDWRYGEEGGESLLFALDTWSTKASLAAPGTYLKVGTEENHRIVGFSLPLLPQDDKYVYLSFKQGNGEGGKNRWFGRGRKEEDVRSDASIHQLAEKLHQAWHTFFPTTLPEKHPTLSGDWLLLARLPLADLDPATPKRRRVVLKTLILETLAQAFVVAEKLRDDSIQGIETTATSATRDSTSTTKMTAPLNHILYGPPGTGKTYYTKTRAVGIVEELTDEEVAARYNREELSIAFEEYHKTGQVEFVTFHQSFGYEDFVEGIKPTLNDIEADGTDEAKPLTGLSYMLADGIFKTLAKRGLYAAHLQKQKRLTKESTAPIAKQADFDSTFEAFVDYLRERLENEPPNSIIFQSKHKTRLALQAVSDKGTAYFRYENGFSANLPQVTRNGLRKIDIDNPLAGQAVGEPDFVVKYGRDRTVYWAAFKEFVAFRAQEQPQQSQPTSQPTILSMLERATADPNIVSEVLQNPATRTLLRRDYDTAPRFVLIIDEINRGNVANIFGELITLLEDDKRAGRPEALTVKLPYSKEDFTVPENLYLLGTMNTADRSVEALDTALRRRFSFTEMRPEPQVIRDEVGVVEGVDVARILEVLNSRLEQLLDRDHCLGHALLLRVQSLDDLRAAFQRNIVPLLQEYFFGDWGKIGLVLGPKFVEIIKANAPGRFALANFPGYDSGNMREKQIYRFTAPATWDVAAFQSIYFAPSATPA